MPNAEVISRYSCKRKTDYTTYGAILFFVFTIIAEICLTLFVPIYLRHKTAFEQDVARGEMLRMLDILRSTERGIPGANSLNNGEKELVRNVLDSYAYYLRTNQALLTREDVNHLQMVFLRYNNVQQRWLKQKFYLVREQLDPSSLRRQLLEQAKKQPENKIGL